MFDLKEWLIRNVGMGENPAARRGLFAKLERLTEAHGDAALVIIAEVWLRAKEVASKQPPAHWFCRAVKLRMLTAGYWVEASPFAGLTHEELVRKGFPDDGPLPLFDDPMDAGQPTFAQLRDQRDREKRQAL